MVVGVVFFVWGWVAGQLTKKNPGIAPRKFLGVGVEKLVCTAGVGLAVGVLEATALVA